MSSKARIVVAFVIFIGILFGAVYPTRTYLAQQRDLRAAHQKLALFKQQNGHLEAEEVADVTAPLPRLEQLGDVLEGEAPLEPAAFDQVVVAVVT